MTTSRSLTLRLKPHLDGQSIAGWVVDESGDEHYFAGWLGLLTLLEQARLVAACGRQHGGGHEGTGRREHATSEETPMDHTAIVKERRLMPRTAGHSFWRREKEGIMRRRILPILVAGALMAFGATPAFGDTGPPGPPVDIPGTTFPEQPGWTPDSPSCQAILGNPGTSLGGVFDQHVPTFVDDQTTALLVDACELRR